MRRHTYISKTQLRQIRVWKDNLRHNEDVLQEDFSENFQTKQQDEIMSAQWVTTSVTIFTVVLNTNSGVKSYAVISDELHCYKHSAAAFNRAIVVLHIFTDGAGSQFKNRFTLSRADQRQHHRG